MSPRQFLTIFGGFGLFLGGLGAIPLLFVSGGQIGPSLLMLAVGMSLSLVLGLYRLVQLRYSEAARERFASQMESAPPVKWMRKFLPAVLLTSPPVVVRALDVPILIVLLVDALCLALLVFQLHRTRHR